MNERIALRRVKFCISLLPSKERRVKDDFVTRRDSTGRLAVEYRKKVKFIRLNFSSIRINHRKIIHQLKAIRRRESGRITEKRIAKIIRPYGRFTFGGSGEIKVSSEIKKKGGIYDDTFASFVENIRTIIRIFHIRFIIKIELKIINTRMNNIRRRETPNRIRGYGRIIRTLFFLSHRLQALENKVYENYEVCLQDQEVKYCILTENQKIKKRRDTNFYCHKAQ